MWVTEAEIQNSSKEKQEETLSRPRLTHRNPPAENRPVKEEKERETGHTTDISPFKYSPSRPLSREAKPNFLGLVQRDANAVWSDLSFPFWASHQ